MKYGNRGTIINMIKKILPQHTIITKINAQLQHILRTHYQHHKLKNTVNVFEEKFCVNEALAKVEHNTLKVFLQEFGPPP